LYRDLRIRKEEVKKIKNAEGRIKEIKEGRIKKEETSREQGAKE
jgi:hypothetical protein